MPFCTACGYHFNGRGSHCSAHKTYLQDTHDYYASDYRDATPIRNRTGRFRSQPRKPRQIGYYDSYNALDTYNPRTALPSRVFTVDQALRSENLRPLLTAFNHLADTNSIASLTYAISPVGDLSLTAHANLNREQCQVCLQYFPDRQRLDMHHWETVACDKHKICLRQDEVVLHAMSERHSRCFVRNCGSVYRQEGGRWGWKGSVVEDHVRERHG
jgi:hypothetical protein